jgi:hypothetical protein
MLVLKMIGIIADTELFDANLGERREPELRILN